MKIIIPMAGTGDRFLQQGYIDPKPLIKVDNKRIIEYICEMFDVVNDEIIFICNENHIKNTDMQQILTRIVPSCKIVSIPSHKKGAVFTVVNANINDHIDDNEEVIICYCDNPYLWEYQHFKNWVKENKSDGCILSHQGFHPHRLSPTFMAHIKEENMRVIEIKEKEPYTNNPINEHASTGTYYFRKGEYIKKYFQQLIDLNLHHKGEFYATLVYNLLIRDELTVHVYPTDFVMVFGTPAEVENYQAWQTILNSTQVKNENDLIKCYRYWKLYNEKRNS